VKFLCIHISNLSMKTKAICSFFVLFAIVAGIGAITPAAFADHAEVSVATGSVPLSTPGCEETGECYTPSTATVDVGGVVTMTNTDAAGIHTYTSGTVDGFTPSPDGTFDSGILNADQSFEWSPDTIGEYPYYCMLHTWMQGTIIVQEAEAAEEEHMEEEVHEEETMEETHEEAMEEELVVTITDSVMGDGTHVNLEFSEIHVNYQITAMQNGEEIFKEAAHAMEMTGANHHIDAVGSDESPIDIEIVSLGIGPPGANQDWTGPTGTVATTQVVPEFGTIAMMVLAVAIISIIAVTAKSRVIPRF
jgi:predicted secreted protein with PEFG-CTERM motif